MAVVLIVGAVIVGTLAHTGRASAVDGTGPTDLINDWNLDNSPLFGATASQQAALQALEQQAVSNTLTDHQLPSSDYDAAQTWGRDTALGELWALLVQAINTPADQQSFAQQNAVAWLQNVVSEQNIESADDAGLEYAKWAGLGANNYEALLGNSPSESAIQNFLSGTPVNYGNDQATGQRYDENSPASTSNEGYCVYDPPAPTNTSQYYPNNIYNDAAPQDCYTPCTDVSGCPPPTPTEQNFVTWGAADFDDDIFGDGSNQQSQEFSAVSNDVGEGLTYAIAATAGTVAGGALSFSSSFASAIAGGWLANTITPFGGIEASALSSTADTVADVAEGAVAASDVGGFVAIFLIFAAIASIAL
jgi:CheY-like chemotaxis protein